MSPAAIRKSVRWTCRFKNKFTTERDAMQGLLRIPPQFHPGLEIYICHNCGYMHWGHKPKHASRIAEAFA
jgi:rubrerythrin